MSRESSIPGLADVMKKGSGTQLIVGIIILIIGIGTGLSLKNVLIMYLANCRWHCCNYFFISNYHQAV